MAKIYLASSWRNEQQPALVTTLRDAGHDVYDFRNPPDGIPNGFRWSDIDPDWMNWTADQYRAALNTPLAEQGFNSDFTGMKWADTGVLLLPCGRSAHLELGWMAGAGKRTIVVTRDGEEPELMAKLAGQVVGSWDELIEALKPPVKEPLPDGDYAVVECMGHRSYIGRVTEVTRFGAQLLQVEPIWQDALLPPVLVNGASLYNFTPVSRDAAQKRQATQSYQLTEAVRANIPPLALPAPARQYEDEDM